MKKGNSNSQVFTLFFLGKKGRSKFFKGERFFSSWVL